MAARLVKIIFELNSQDWHGHGSETLWAVPVSAAADDAHFRIENSPFFATGIGYLDVIKAQPTEDPTIHRFEEIVTRGGHSTYMLLVEEKSSGFGIHWSVLGAKGCSYESMHIKLSIGERLLLSVDIPPSADLLEAYDVLKQGAADGTWMFQEGYAHLPA
ncbi:MAG: DUF4265 domain-containing protein [Reyranella sp.]|nr:DUF4265 domain-containing protein [Reyranella sp.]